jgi:hypothetical protein
MGWSKKTLEKKSGDFSSVFFSRQKVNGLVLVEQSYLCTPVLYQIIINTGFVFPFSVKISFMLPIVSNFTPVS